MTADLDRGAEIAGSQTWRLVRQVQRHVKVPVPTAFAVVALLFSLSVGIHPASAVAAKAHDAPPRHLSAVGGLEEFSAAVASRTRCSWDSVPSIVGFAKSLPCGAGTVSRCNRFEMNDSPNAESWLVTLTVFGAHTRVIHWTVSEAAPGITYSASVGPSVTQSPVNPFEATYSYSADAIATAGQTSVDLDAIGKLPDGVLLLLSGGSPACSTDVGDTVTSGECTIDYMTLGLHSVTARYKPDAPTANEPFETSGAAISSYSTSTSENITKGGSTYGLDNGTYTLYSATYTVTANTVDQYGYTVASVFGSWSFQVSGLATDGNTFETTITPPPGQTSCIITISSTLYDDYSSQSSSVSSPDCSGGLNTGNADPPMSPGNNVSGWFVKTVFASTSAGFSASSSGSEDIVCEEPGD